MTVSFIDVPGPLSNTYEPIDFTTTRLVTSISVEFNPTGGRGARESVWDGPSGDGSGDFSFSYRNSTRSGSGPYTWSVRRDLRWPAEFRIRVQELPEGAAPALQPLIYSPLGAWALDSTAGGGLVADRSGNGRLLADPPMSIGADLRSGHTSVYGNLMSLASPAHQAAFIFDSSPFTVILRYCNRGSDEFIVGSTVGTSGLNCAWELRRSGQNVGYQSGAFGSPSVASMTGNLLSVGPWYVLSLRRNLARTSVRLGLNGTFSTHAVSASTPHAANELRFGSSQAAPYVAGGISDCVIWPVELSDGEVSAAVAAMLGT